MTAARRAIAKANRLVVKVGSSSLTHRGGGIDADRVHMIARVIAERHRAGKQVILVTSGAIATGFPLLGIAKRPRDLATKQAAASVGQGVLIAQYAQAFAEHDLTVGQVLLTQGDVTRRAHYRNAQRALFRLLELGVVPIVNENDTVATDEIRLGDNDRLAALVAHLVDADGLVLLSDVDGLYDGPPGDPGVSLVPTVRSSDDLAHVRIGGVGKAGVGLGGMSTKVAAAQIANSAGIPTLLAAADDAATALADASVGTVFHATGERRAIRLLWLEHATRPSGSIAIDAGAVEALVHRRKSLLAVGVVSVQGTFEAGDPVDVCTTDGALVARGLVNFDSGELAGLIGRSTRDLARELGPAYEREVIHRDDLVILG